MGNLCCVPFVTFVLVVNLFAVSKKRFRLKRRAVPFSAKPAPLLRDKTLIDATLEGGRVSHGERKGEPRAKADS